MVGNARHRNESNASDALCGRLAPDRCRHRRHGSQHHCPSLAGFHCRGHRTRLLGLCHHTAPQHARLWPGRQLHQATGVAVPSERCWQLGDHVAAVHEPQCLASKALVVEGREVGVSKSRLAKCCNPPDILGQLRAPRMQTHCKHRCHGRPQGVPRQVQRALIGHQARQPVVQDRKLTETAAAAAPGTTPANRWPKAGRWLQATRHGRNARPSTLMEHAPVESIEHLAHARPLAFGGWDV
mmetsp:Transcript_13079/g.39600  ORF Transcript_13079/g.39600 Transcript_13079/m.39600 type:complete len:240 (+) Transcript_13079:659-1378(+)